MIRLNEKITLNFTSRKDTMTFLIPSAPTMEGILRYRADKDEYAIHIRNYGKLVCSSYGINALDAINKSIKQLRL